MKRLVNLIMSMVNMVILILITFLNIINSNAYYKVIHKDENKKFSGLATANILFFFSYVYFF